MELGRAGWIDHSKQWMLASARLAGQQIDAQIVWTRDGSPIRDVQPRSRTAIGKYNSRKAGRLLAHRSRGHGYVGGEKLAIMRQEIDFRVADLRTYHVRIDLPGDGAIQSIFPPILTLDWSGEVVAIFVEGDLGRARISHRTWDHLTRVFDEIGWRVEVLSDYDLAPTSRVRQNIVAIQADRFATVSAAQILLVMNALREEGGRATVAALQVVLGEQGAMAIINALICTGLLYTSLEDRRDAGLVVYLTEELKREQVGQ